MRRGILIGILVLTFGAAIAAAVMLWRGRAGEPITVAVLHTATGANAVIEVPIVAACRQAVREINAAGGVLGRPLRLEVRDCGTEAGGFARAAAELLRDPSVAVLIGGGRSAARRSMLEVLEREGGLLLYPLSFEGLENSPNVVYLGLTPALQIGSAVDWALARGAKRFFLLGEDRISSRMQTTIARDMVLARGGSVVGERMLTGTNPDLTADAAAIAKARPDVILNSVSGETNAAIMRALRAAGVDPAVTTIVSVALTEAAIEHMGPEHFAGTMLAASYFSGLDLPANQRFLESIRREEGSGIGIGDAMAAAYVGLHLWARAVEDAGSLDEAAVHRALGGRHAESPYGPVAIDASTHYAWKPMRLGRVRPDGEIEIVWDSVHPLPPAPWPMWRPRREWEAMVEEVRTSWGGSWEPPAAAARSAPLAQEPPR